MATAAPSAIGGFSALIGNIAMLAAATGIAWAGADLVSQAIGGYGARVASNAAAGAVAGALAGAILSVLYWGAYLGTPGRLLFLVVLWVLAEVVLNQVRSELVISTYEEYLAVFAAVGLVVGAIFAVSLQARKPGWWIIKVPLAALAMGFATAIGRIVQFESFTF